MTTPLPSPVTGPEAGPADSGGSAAAVPLTVWCVSDGRTGIERQTLAVAEALAALVPVRRTVLRLTPGAPQLWLPPGLWPMPLAALPAEQRAQLAHPWPDVWIGCGRRSVPYSLRVRGWSGGQSLVVQLQDPQVDPARFDLVVPPRHDGLSGPTVVSTFGAPVWYGDAAIEAARAQVPDLDPAGGAPRLVVIVGGTSKRHSLGPARVQMLVAELERVAALGARLWITTSRRTPDHAVSALRACAARIGARFFASEAEDGPNPYLAWLASADGALVTEDSTNLITDALFFGLPVHLLRLDGTADARFAAFHRALTQAGHASFAPWTHLPAERPEPVRDARDVAHAILDRLAARRA